MEEIIDVINPQTGEPTGEKMPKSVAHKLGIWHRSIHIMIISTDRTKTLLQKRAATKPLYPNMWDIAVGGHISAGETPLEAAKRELEEELGLNMLEYEIEEVDHSIEELNNGGVHSKEWVSNYVIYADVDLAKIKLQKEEVGAADWFNKEQLNEIIAKKEAIPHIIEYEILNNILISKENKLSLTKKEVI